MLYTIVPTSSKSNDKEMAMFSSISNPLFILILFIALTTTTTTSHARPLISSLGLVPRLGYPSRVVEDSPTCWDSLMQLSACSGEVVMFFLNGETYLGQSCCKAIETIDGRCSPVLISTLLGYTTMERDVLEEYCNGVQDSTGKGLRIESRRKGVLHGGVLSSPPN